MAATRQNDDGLVSTALHRLQADGARTLVDWPRSLLSLLAHNLGDACSARRLLENSSISLVARVCVSIARRNAMGVGR